MSINFVFILLLSIVFYHISMNRCVDLVSQITRNRGLMVCGQIKIGPFGPVSGYEDRWLKQGKIGAFHTICTGKGSVLLVSTKKPLVVYLPSPENTQVRPKHPCTLQKLFFHWTRITCSCIVFGGWDHCSVVRSFVLSTNHLRRCKWCRPPQTPSGKPRRVNYRALIQDCISYRFPELIITFILVHKICASTAAPFYSKQTMFLLQRSLTFDILSNIIVC